jgi:hypothetical protein
MNMFDEGVNWQDGICDWCYRRDFDRKAREKAPGVFAENSNEWSDGKFTKEKSEIWKEALRQTELEMTKKCAVFGTADGDQGKICYHCLMSVLKQSPVEARWHKWNGEVE